MKETTAFRLLMLSGGEFDWAKHVENSALIAGKDKWNPVFLPESLFKFLLGIRIGLEGITFYRSSALLLDASIYTGYVCPSRDDL